MNIIGLIIVFATATFPAFQLSSLIDAGNITGLFSQYLGMAALVLMAWTQLLAARIRGMETVFSGLDQIYVLHKYSGITAMLAMLVHSTIDADVAGSIRGLFAGPAEGMGEVSMYGLLILSALSVATFIPYNFWKWSHKAMGALFALGALHFIGVAKPFAMTDPAGLYTGAFCVAGLLAYACTLLPDRFRPSKGYSIANIEQTGGATAVTLRPDGRGLKPTPGQFGIVRFTGSGRTEPHPYTFSGIEADGSLRVTIKGLGDFTKTIGPALKVDQDVRVQGPFGRFCMTVHKRQVWIAGGIGITPFLTWADALPADAPDADLFYCTKSRADAPHLEEIKQLAEAKPNLNLHLIVSSEGQRLNAGMIKESVGDALKQASVSFCGSTPMRESLQKELQAYGVSKGHFRFEEFEFRSGLGIKRFLDRVIVPIVRTIPVRKTARSPISFGSSCKGSKNVRIWRLQ